MNDKAKLAVGIILAGLTLGVLGDALLRVGPWGLNVSVWTAFLLMAIAALAGTNRVSLDREARVLIVPVLATAAGFAWRESEALKVLDLAGLCTLLALGACRARGGRLLLGGVVEHANRLLRPAWSAVGGYLPLFASEVDWRRPTPAGWGGPARSVGVGLVLAAPLLVVFGALLISADAVFGRLVTRLVDIDLSNLVSHLIPIAICAWVTGGYLVGLFFRKPPALEQVGTGLPQVSLGPLELGVALGSLNVLFLAFVVVQARYLFGGGDLVEVTPGLTYAEYARHGFFELVAVAGLVLPVLLAGDWILGAASRRAFRVQAGVMVVMVYVILASALHRLQLYQEAYGWTELRFYVAVAMGWLVLVLAWFALAVLTGHRERFAAGALVAGFVLLVTVHAWNPGDWIVRQNLARAAAGREWDAEYAARLGGDAVPALVEALPTLPPDKRQIILRALGHWRGHDRPDWRLWSYSRMKAREALAGRELVERASR